MIRRETSDKPCHGASTEPCGSGEPPVKTATGSKPFFHVRYETSGDSVRVPVESDFGSIVLFGRAVFDAHLLVHLPENRLHGLDPLFLPLSVVGENRELETEQRAPRLRQH